MGGELLYQRLAWLFAPWYLAHLYLVGHVFTQKARRLAAADALFVRPHYDGLLAAPSLLLNRRRYMSPLCRLLLYSEL